MKFLTLLIGLTTLLFTEPLWSQQQSSLDIALRYIESHQQEWGLQEGDIHDLVVSDSYISAHNGVQHIYFKQQYRGIPIFNAIGSVHIKPDGKVAIANQRFESQVASRVSALRSATTPQRALQTLLAKAYAEVTTKPTFIKNESKSKAHFTGGDLSAHPIVLEQQYLPMPDGTLKLTWGTTIVETNSNDAWLIHLDALTGEPINQRSIVISCQFESADHHDCHFENHQKQKAFKPVFQALLEQNDGAQYRVFPVPVESPIHGNRDLVVNPADPIASPYGWHDVDGREGPEYLTTRGNNVNTYIDLIADNQPDENTEVTGGAELIFDFPFENQNSPEFNEKATLTQLFYMNNVMHDFTYHYGFDELAGNFQSNNYGRGGRGSDFVNAEAQDGSGLNNANFLTLPDGENSRMQMFLWVASRNNRLEINSPAVTGENRFRFGTASFGPIQRDTVQGNIVSVISDDFDNNSGCGVIFNSNQLDGAIALVRRGDCSFEEKVKNLEDAGAIAVIITNTEDDIINMAGIDTLPDPLIPAVSVSLSDGDRIRAALDQGEVYASLEAPEFLDSGFDNGVIAHEYGHGISNRLTGGPSEAFCLFNNEQMGEGWSDFFALVTTVTPDNSGTLPRGIGNYVTGREVTGRGIRRKPYSTSFDINDQTYDDVIGTNAPHPLGEVWAATLWDLYWSLTDAYGWDPDLYTGTGGNNIAIQLVMDGMKLQACRPGFIDGRDAIIAADQINYNGANECLIWEVFARRGLGWYARQGSSSTRNDNIEDYSVPPTCIQDLKISKTSTPVIEAGDTFQVVLTITNDKLEDVTDVVVTEDIPEGATPLPNTFVGGVEVVLEGDILAWSIGDLPAGATTQLRYQLVSSPLLISKILFADDMESGIGGWRLRSIAGQEGWRLTNTKALSGERAWFVPNTDFEQDQSLQLLRGVLLNYENPVLRFNHSFDIEPGLDGGVVEGATDGGFNWSPITGDNFFRTSYTGRLAAGTLGADSRQAYWGSQEEFVASYLDLSNYQGGTFNMRFRLGATENDNQTTSPQAGWYIDDVSIFDMVNYQSEACVTSAQGDRTCALIEERGTIVEPQETDVTNTDDLLRSGIQMNVFPNPANEVLNVQLNQDVTDNFVLELLTIEGRSLIQYVGRDRQVQLQTAELSAGFYMLRMTTGQEQIVQKIIIE